MKKFLLTAFVLISSIQLSETIYNGIELPKQFPIYRKAVENAKLGMKPYYLNEIPKTIIINNGRQLFVDDFLIKNTTLEKKFHYGEKMEKPVLVPDKEWEKIGENGAMFAAPFSDGVWFDEKDNKFKMYYYAGGGKYNTDSNSGVTCYAESVDGINWIKPNLDIVKGTNIILKDSYRDSNTVWLDKQEKDLSKRFKMFMIQRIDKKWYYVYFVSADGIHFKEIAKSKPLSDRSTVYKNPFRDVWAFSIRHNIRNPKTRELTRARDYMENKDALDGVKNATADLKYFWFGPWEDEIRHKNFPATVPGIYNMDAIAYESIMLGFFTVWAGPENNAADALKIHKQNQIMLGYSRDGFMFNRDDMNPFIKVSDKKEAFDSGNIQSTVGSPIIVGDKLYFYYSGRTYDKNDNKITSTGLATLRRDGFVSMSGTGELETNFLRLDGKYLFVNADVKKALKVEILDSNNNILKGYEKENSIAFTGDSTKVLLSWKNNKDLSNIKDKKIKIKFYLEDGELYSFWITNDLNGKSYGYTAGGKKGLNIEGTDK